MSFYRENTVKATRKDHHCYGCRKTILAGTAAVRWSGMTDGDFGVAVYHPDCRAAEIAYNQEVVDSFCEEDWASLDEVVADGGEDWLRDKFPVVADRLCGILPEPRS